MAGKSVGHKGLGIGLIVIALLAFVSSILIPVALPFISDAGTNIKATVTTYPTVNTTIDKFIGLLDYFALFWYIGIILALIIGAIGGIMFATSRFG